MKIDNSNLLKEKANMIIPHHTGTFSSAASNFVEGIYPVYAKKANGCKFVDVDDNEYVDYLMGLGPVTLGYNYESVNKAIIEQLNEGILFSLPHPKEVELSELIIKTIPHAQMVKLEKTGSNAVTGAVRAARALTKRDKIAYCGSGGVWHDWQAAMVSRDGGVPSFNNELIKIFDYNDNEGLEQIFDDNPNEISCIVLEPTIYEKPDKSFLKQVRKICDEHNSILILDEIVTGFRFHLQGAQKFFDVKGDFVCFGKGIGNGLPISAITGPTEFMNIFNELWVSSTNNREMLSIAGTIATINEMKEKQTIDHCWKLGEIFLNGWNKICMNCNIDAKLFGYPVRMMMKCFDTNKIESKSLKSLILQEMIKKRHFISPGPIFLSYSHTKEDISNTLNSFDDVCQFISANVLNDQYEKFLEGTMPKTIWTMKISPTKKVYSK